MAKKEDIKEKIYKTQQVFERRVELLESDDKVSDANKVLIKQFVESKIAEGRTMNRVTIVLDCMRRLAHYTDTSFDKMEKKDVTSMLAKLEQSDYAENTKTMTKKVIKNFYRWLHGLGKNDPLPDIVRNIETRTAPNKLTRKDLLTREEVEHMVDASPNLMTKALVSTLYYSAARPLEILALKIKSLDFERQCVVVNIFTGKMEKHGGRRVFLFENYDLLRAWVNQHPKKDNPDAPLWIKNYQGKRWEPFSYRYFGYMITDLAKKAGIKKNVFPYLFRHSRATELYRNMGEAMAKKAMGHALHSREAQRYVKLVDDDLRKAQEKWLGIKNDDEEKQELLKICGGCYAQNRSSNKICSNCGVILDIETAQKFKEEREKKETRLTAMEQTFKAIEDNPVLQKLVSQPDFIEKQAQALAEKMFKEYLEKRGEKNGTINQEATPQAQGHST